MRMHDFCSIAKRVTVNGVNSNTEIGFTRGLKEILV